MIVDESWDWLTLHLGMNVAFSAVAQKHNFSQDRKHPLKTGDMSLNIARYCMHVAYVRDVWMAFDDSSAHSCQIYPHLVGGFKHEWIIFPYMELSSFPLTNSIIFQDG